MIEVGYAEEGETVGHKPAAGGALDRALKEHHHWPLGMDSPFGTSAVSFPSWRPFSRVGNQNQGPGEFDPDEIW
jgi:hypothetical protein